MNKLYKNDYNIFKIEIKGKGTPLFFLPGFTVPGSIWHKIAEKFENNFSCHFFTYAGFNNIKPVEFPWYKKIKDGIIDFIVKNNLSDINVIGHSMGGNLAFEIANELNKKVKKIVVIDTLPCLREIVMPGIDPVNIIYDNPYNNQLLNMDKEEFEKYAYKIAENMTIRKDKLSIIAKWIIEADRKTYVYGYTDLLMIDQRDILKNINCEVLILGASFLDVNNTKRTFENQYVNLKNKKLEIIKNSKHFIMFDQPEIFTLKIYNYFNI